MKLKLVSIYLSTFPDSWCLKSATIVKLFSHRTILLGLEYQLNLPGAYEYRSRDIFQGKESDAVRYIGDYIVRMMYNHFKENPTLNERKTEDGDNNSLPPTDLLETCSGKFMTSKNWYGNCNKKFCRKSLRYNFSAVAISFLGATEVSHLGEILKQDDAQFDYRLDGSGPWMVTRHARIIAATVRIELNNFFCLVSVAICLIRE